MVCPPCQANAILKVAASANLVRVQRYILRSPHRECSKLIHQAGIKKWFTLSNIKTDLGLIFLKKRVNFNSID